MSGAEMINLPYFSWKIENEHCQVLLCNSICRCAIQCRGESEVELLLSLTCFSATMKCESQRGARMTLKISRRCSAQFTFKSNCMRTKMHRCSLFLSFKEGQYWPGIPCWDHVMSGLLHFALVSLLAKKFGIPFPSLAHYHKFAYGVWG